MIKNSKKNNNINNAMDMTTTSSADQMEMETVMISPDMIPDEYKSENAELDMLIGISSVIGTRQYQQDSVFADKYGSMSIGIVCDGMGGMSSGDKASETAIRLLAGDFYKLKENDDLAGFLREEAQKMDEAVSEIDADNDLGSGTTVVAAIVKNGKMYWMSVGDSRIYVIRNNEIIQLTRDHNLKLKLDAELEAGDITMSEYERDMEQGEALISYLGIGNTPIIDVSQQGVDLLENDIIILCSDGLYKRLSDADIFNTVMLEEPDMKRAAKRLTDVVMMRTERSQDNTSVVVMQYNRYK